MPPGLRRDLDHLLEETATADVTRFVWLRQFEPGSNPPTPTGCWTASITSSASNHLQRLDVPGRRKRQKGLTKRICSGVR